MMVPARPAKRAIAALASFLIFAAAQSVTPGVARADGHSAATITVEAKGSVDEAKQRLVAAIERAGATLFAVVDHRANAQGAGLELPAAQLVIFGNPKVGTPIMQADATAGLDLPVRILIHDDGGTTRIVTTAPDELARRYRLDGAAEALKKMRGALDKLMAAAAG